MVACSTILNSLESQLAGAFVITPSGDGCLIQTPFEYPDRRVIAIHVSERASGELELSDDGYAHSYARMSGVGREALKIRADELAQRFNADAAHGEVVVTTSVSDFLFGVLAIVGGSQGIADTVAHKRIRVASARLDRQIARALVVHNRVYDRNGKVPLGELEIDVDYNVLPTDEYQQLSLFTVPQSVKLRGAESMAYRIGRILEANRSPVASGRVLVIADEAGAFKEPSRWRKVRETIKGTGVDIVPISEQRTIARWLTA